MTTLDRFSTVLQDPMQWQRRWRQYFGNDNPITLELGCGKAEVSVGLAERYPHRNFVGIDIKGARLWVGARDAAAKKLVNICFIRLWADHLPHIFAASEVAELWITFPDPFRKRAQEKRRLTSSRFISIYRKVLQPEGKIHVKTDDDDLFQFTMDEVEKEKCLVHKVTWDLYQDLDVQENLTIQSHYEKLHLRMGKKIKYLCFSL